MTNEYNRNSFEHVADVVNFICDIEREVLLEIAEKIDVRLRDEFARMMNEEGWTGDELGAILEQSEPGSTATMDELIRQKLDEHWDSPEQKKSRRRNNWRAFVRGLGGIGAGMAAIGEGMSNIGIGPRPRK